MNRIKNLIGGIGMAAVLTTGFIATMATPAMAHDTLCPYCKMKVLQDTKDMDNEVVLKYGLKKIEYRCVMCALAQAKTKYKDKAELSIVAPSPVKDKPVTITRKNGDWSSSPANAVFVFQKGNHAQCNELYRATADQATARAWATKHNLKDAQYLSLKEMVEASK
ncbi:MAG: organomercurial lyase [Fimbriimonadaceae bacterium]